MPYFLALITVFISSFSTMVIELIAGRMVAPSLGVSLYTWTTVIGVVLAGIGLGNYFGGRIADKFPRPRTLSILLLLSAIASLAIIFLVKFADALPIPISLPIIFRFSLFIGLIFFIPTAILGTITPVVIKLSLSDLSRVGVTIGTVYAISLFGSILGTFATGFYLISLFGTRVIVALVAGLLALLALIVGGRVIRFGTMLLVGMLLALWILAFARGALASPCTRETNYYCIKVLRVALRDEGDEPVLALRLDRLDHAYRNENNPLKLIYEYEKVYAILATQLVRENPALDLLFLGGGGYVFPIYVERTWRGTNISVAEIDPGVTETARQSFGLVPESRIVTYDQDARQFDLIVGDAFNDYSVPYHLTTREFLQLLKAHLAPNGVYMANTIDAPRTGHFVRAHVQTMQAVFKNVYLVANTADWEFLFRATFVIVATDRELNLGALMGIGRECHSEHIRFAQCKLREESCSFNRNLDRQ
ncbi:MAG: fused MFS/spermidine synthase [Chloroflexi bacterium]|nr:fused MFS/spermidine synthase [Chloroflexota bacterium]